MRGLSSLLAITVAAASSNALAQTSAVPIGTQISCEDAESIKFNRAEYESRSSVDQRLVDGTYQQCQITAEAEKSGDPPTERVVFVANPVPTGENDRVFYGTIKIADLENAQRNCTTGGVAGGVVISIAGAAMGNPAAEQAGAVIYEFSDVVCSSLADAFTGDNILTLLAPTNIVAHAVAGQALDTIVAQVPLVSAADKAAISKVIKSGTQPPSVKVGDGKVHIDAGPGGGIGLNIPKKIPLPKPKLPVRF